MMAYSIEIERAEQIESKGIEAHIEDPRGHSPEARERLRQLLTRDSPARPDPKRADVFEVDDQEQIFYVHIAKTSGSVTLLAVWNRDTVDNTAT
jgi:hypothetical protein